MFSEIYVTVIRSGFALDKNFTYDVTNLICNVLETELLIRIFVAFVERKRLKRQVIIYEEVQ